MTIPGIQVYKVSQVVYYCIAGISLGLIYIILVDGFDQLFPFINGLIIGFLVGLMIGLFEVYLFHARFQLKSFAAKLFLRVSAYMSCVTVIIIVIVTINRAVRHQQGFFEALVSRESIDYFRFGDFKTAIVFGLITAVIVNFARLTSLKIGRGTLRDFFLGVYHKPRISDRIFVFIQVINADQILKSGSLETYHSFVNKVYCEISVALMHSKGYVYDYVDNRFIAYWKGTGAEWVQFIINFYREVHLAIKENEEYFALAFSIIPKLAWAAHGGPVVQAEIGELKTEIVFHGDVLNTAARMMDIAVERDIPILISDFVKVRLGNLKGIDIKCIGEIPLKGKLQPVPLFEVNHVVI